MYIYLPIAEISANIMLIVSIGVVSGMIAGLFSIGGSFLGIPILVAYGIDSSTVVSSFSHQMLTSSFANVTQDIQQKKIDFKLVRYTFIGGLSGVLIGIYLLKKLTFNGQIDIVVSFLYIAVLGSIASFMIVESGSALKKKYFTQESEDKNLTNIINPEKDLFCRIDIFPCKIFINEDAQVSIFMIVFFGFVAGLLVAIAGIASGLIMIPVMTYLYKMHIRNSMATANLHGALLLLCSNILQIITVKKTDIILSMLLLFGTVIGVIISRKFAHKVPPEELRMSLAVLMLIIVMRIVLNIIITPNDVFIINLIN